MNKDINIIARHILDSIDAITSYLKGVSKSDLEKDRLKQSAVIRELEVIGEAVKNISESIKKEYPNIQWKQIVGMRDKLIHHYFGVDLDTIWETIEKDIPNLEKCIKQILQKNNK